MNEVLDHITIRETFLKSLQEQEVPKSWAQTMLQEIRELIEKAEWERIIIHEGEYEKDTRINTQAQASHSSSCNE